MSDNNGFEDEAELDAFREQYEEHREALFELVSDYADERQIDDGLFAALLLDIAVSSRMLGYAYSVEKPSVAGLRLELDRFAKDAAEHVREVKAGAEEFIAEVKANRDAN